MRYFYPLILVFSLLTICTGLAEAKKIKWVQYYGPNLVNIPQETRISIESSTGRAWSSYTVQEKAALLDKNAAEQRNAELKKKQRAKADKRAEKDKQAKKKAELKKIKDWEKREKARKKAIADAKKAEDKKFQDAIEEKEKALRKLHQNQNKRKYR
jgi:hypothetical protein